MSITNLIAVVSLIIGLQPLHALKNAPDISTLLEDTKKGGQTQMISSGFFVYCFGPKISKNFNPKLAQGRGVAQTPSWGQNTRMDPL